MYEVPTGWVRHAADQLGAESPVVVGAMRHAGLPRRILADGSEAVRCTAFVAFVEQAARLADDDLLGFNLGSSYDLRASGLPGYVAIAAATVREAMANTVRYGALRDTSALYAMDAADGVVRFRIESRSAHMRGSRHATEFKAALILAACHRWVGPGFRPVEMRFAHPRAASRRAIERRFNCPVRFGSDVTEMILSADQLELPVRGADPYLLALVTGHADAALARPGGSRHGDLAVAGRAGRARGAAEGRADARRGRRGARDRRAHAGAPAVRARARRSAGSSTSSGATWPRATLRTPSSSWRRSPTCSATPSRALSRARSGAGRAGRRAGFG